MNVFELFAKIGLDDSEYKSGLSKAADMGKSAIGGIGKIAKVGMGVATAAIGAGTAAMGAFGKSALDSYANYEQLVGGVDKLYGNASKKVQQYAEQAYKTSGMSANKYMETATSFSASLLKSLNGDAEKAADITDVAMRAMSDNVNTFGSDIESVQNAFQGLAKNNFTMLDNLKLGYAGSKEGMEQLIERANELRIANGELGDLSIESFSDMITAIQTVQEDLGVAGTTAKEAMTTIEGSATATKAAWENLITAIGRGEGLQDAIGGLKDAIFGIGLTEDGKETGLLNQVIPRIQTIMEGAGQFIVESAPTISEKIPELVDAVLPSLLEGGITLVGAIGQGVIDAFPSVWTAAENAASTIGDYLSNGMEKAAQATEGADFTTPIGNALDKVDEFLNGEKTQNFIDNGVTVVSNIAEGIGQAAPDMLTKAADIVVTFVQGIEDNIPQILDAGGDMAIGLAVGLAKALPKLWLELQMLKLKVLAYIGEHIASFSVKAWQGVKSIIQKVVEVLPELPEKMAYYAGYAVTKFFIAWLTFPDKVEEKLDAIVDKIIKWKDELGKKAKEASDHFKDKFKGGIDEIAKDIWDWGVNIANKFLGGIKSILDGAGDLFSAFTGGATKATNEYNAAQTRGKTGMFSSAPVYSEIESESNSVFDEESGFDYEALALAIVKAFTDANITVECDNREFGRLVRKAVTT